VSQPEIAKKITKTSYFGGFKVVRRPSSGKISISSFLRGELFDALFLGESFHPVAWNLLTIHYKLYAIIRYKPGVYLTWAWIGSPPKHFLHRSWVTVHKMSSTSVQNFVKLGVIFLTEVEWSNSIRLAEIIWENTYEEKCKPGLMPARCAGPSGSTWLTTVGPTPDIIKP